MGFVEEFVAGKNKVTVILVAINVIVFIGLTTIGMTEDATFMLEHGAMYVPYILENQEYYRLFTSMFLHFGIQHLGNNMLLLFLVGSQLEQELGSIKYLILYILSGLAGNVLSMMWEIDSSTHAVSGGASGAVYGVIGAMLWVVIRNRGRVGTMTSQGLALMIGISLYYGFTSTGIDNLAHIGGLVSGFILAMILYWKLNNNRRARTNS